MPDRPPSPLVGPPPRRSDLSRASRLRRLLPIGAVCVVAFGTGAAIGARHEPSERRVATRFAAAWERGDYASMYGLLSDRARDRVSLRRFARAYRRAADTATLASLKASRPRSDGDARVSMDVTATTRVFGAITGEVELETEQRADGDPGIAWRADHVFPGLRRGERLRRETHDAARGRRSRRATGRRSPRARRASPSSARSPRRSPGGSGPRRPSARRS